ncbi:putative reverse transcriptase domain-containing protein [Tanacetum coccineum]
MAPKRAPRSTPVTENPTTTTVTNAQLQAMIDQGVTAALTARDANRNGDDSHTSGNDYYSGSCPCNAMENVEEDDDRQVLPEGWKLRRFKFDRNVESEESDKVEKYVGGLPDMIHGSVMATKPKTMQDAIEITGVFARIEVMKPWNNKLKVTKARGIGKDQAMLESTLLKTSCQGKQNFNYIKFCVGPFKVLEQVESVAYKLKLPQELSWVHNTFHVSNLKKCYSDDPLVVPLEGLQVDNKLHFVEEPVEIIDREVKQLRRSRVLIVKGLCTENLIHHIKHFLSIVDHIQVDGATKDASRLCFFYFSLKGKANEWLEKIPPRIITSLKQLVSKFLDKFFSPEQTSLIRDKILRFHQGERKPIKDSWIRFQDLFQQAPHHGISKCADKGWERIEDYVQYQDNMWGEPSPIVNISSIPEIAKPTFEERPKADSENLSYLTILTKGKRLRNPYLICDICGGAHEADECDSNGLREQVSLLWHLEDIHVTWTQFEKKQDKIATLHEEAKKCIQTLETTSGFKAMPSGFGSGCVIILATVLEHSRQSGLTASQFDETASRDKEDHSTCTRTSLQKFGVATLKFDNRNGEFGPKAAAMFADEDADTMLRAYDDGVLEFV